MSVDGMDTLSDLDVWVPALSALIPLLTALAVKQDGSNITRSIVAVVASVLLAVVSEVTQSGGATVTGLFVTAVTAFVIQLAFYLGIWAQVGVNDRVVPTVGLQ